MRLEDFSLNGLAWSRTDAIGVMADYPCYQWIIHQENSHKASYDYDVYWRSFVESLAPVLELPEGDKRDQLLIRWYKSRVLERVKALHGWPEDHVTRLLGTFAGLLPRSRRCAANSTRPTVPAPRCCAPATGPAARPRRAGHHGHHLRVTSTGAPWADGRLQVQVEAEVVDRDGRPFALERVGDRVVRRVPDELAEATDPALWDLTDDLAGATAGLVRSRETSVDWILPSTSRVEVTDDLRVRVVGGRRGGPRHVRGRLAPRHGVLRHVLPAGRPRLHRHPTGRLHRRRPRGRPRRRARRGVLPDQGRRAGPGPVRPRPHRRRRRRRRPLRPDDDAPRQRDRAARRPRQRRDRPPGHRPGGRRRAPGPAGRARRPRAAAGAASSPVTARCAPPCSARPASPMFRLAAPGDETGTDRPSRVGSSRPLRSRIAGAVRRVRR